MTFTGYQIRDLRKSYDLAPNELADLLSVQLSTIYRWEGYQRRQVKVDGMSRRLLRLMLEVAEKDRASVSVRFRREGWASGLHKLLSLAYKKST